MPAEGKSGAPEAGSATTLQRRRDAEPDVPSADRVLIAFHHAGGADAAVLAKGETLVVGRLAPSDVRLNDPGLSRRHASLSWTDDGIVVEDLGSTNGTRVGGEPIERRVVSPGETIELGGVTAAIVSTSEPPPGLVGHDQLARLLEQELARARWFERPVAVLFLRASVPVRRWYSQLLPLLRPVDVIGVYSDVAVEIVLPELHRAAALGVATRVVESLAAAGEVACGAATFPGGGGSSDELRALARAAAESATPAAPVLSAPDGPHRLSSEDVAARLISNSAPMKRVLETALRLSRGTIPVLLSGETGTGKELIARLIHQRGPRAEKPLVRVSCAALAADSLEEKLLGNEGGGALELARGGSLLLDEIGELPADAQAALLRTLETERADVRILATTHENIAELVAAGKFREDLYFRLNAMVLDVPPLRARREDIVPLAEAFVGRSESPSGRARRIDPEVLELLEAHRWRGNVRELENAIARAIAISEGDTLTLDDLPEALRSGDAASEAGGEPAGDEASVDLRTRLERYELSLIREALESSGWNQTQAALRLGMPRRTLVYKIRTYGIRRTPEE